MITVAALFVDPKGPYVGVPGVDAWDELRDATLYDGPWPVVAHPPCGPWGSLRHLCSRPHDAKCGPIAVDLVRRWGGVLEHPARSRLFDALSLPRPGELPDAWGGQTLRVDQVDYGHAARKPTWLYCVGVDVSLLPIVPRREPTHWVSGFRSTTNRKTYAKNGSAVPPGIKVCSAQMRRRTPIEFRDVLLTIARSARVQTERAS